MSTIVFDFHKKPMGKGRIRIHKETAPENLEPGNIPRINLELGNIPRITKLMALALKFDQLLREGIAKDYADLARLGHVTRARMSQIMGLLNLAPDIQEDILFLPKTTKGRDAVSSREVIKIATVTDWQEQRELWKLTHFSD